MMVSCVVGMIVLCHHAGYVPTSSATVEDQSKILGNLIEISINYFKNFT